MLITFHLFQVPAEEEILNFEKLDYDAQYSAISADVSGELLEWLQCAVNVFVIEVNFLSEIQSFRPLSNPIFRVSMG